MGQSPEVGGLCSIVGQAWKAIVKLLQIIVGRIDDVRAVDHMRRPNLVAGAGVTKAIVSWRRRQVFLSIARACPRPFADGFTLSVVNT